MIFFLFCDDKYDQKKLHLGPLCLQLRDHYDFRELILPIKEVRTEELFEEI